uniref:basic proline-rich protein-like n=1 Tax=Lonchura striata TaxID=40157 RepID=UPI000B4CE1AA|nr:basic proline-rich protein-like [Lonchura striata domestica]
MLSLPATRDAVSPGGHRPRPTEQPRPRGLGRTRVAGGHTRGPGDGQPWGPAVPAPRGSPTAPGQKRFLRSATRTAAPPRAPRTSASRPRRAQPRRPRPRALGAPSAGPSRPGHTGLPPPLRGHPGPSAPRGSSRRIPAPLTRLPPGPAGRGPGSPRPGAPGASDAPGVPGAAAPPGPPATAGGAELPGLAGPRPRARRFGGAEAASAEPRSPVGPPRRGRPGTEPSPGAALTPPAGAPLHLQLPRRVGTSTQSTARSAVSGRGLRGRAGGTGRGSGWRPLSQPRAAHAPSHGCRRTSLWHFARRRRRRKHAPVPAGAGAAAARAATRPPHARHRRGACAGPVHPAPPPPPALPRAGQRRDGTTDSAGPVPRTAPRSRVGARTTALRALPAARWVRGSRARRTHPGGSPREVPPSTGAPKPGSGPGMVGQGEGRTDGQTDGRTDGDHPPCPALTAPHASPASFPRGGTHHTRVSPLGVPHLSPAGRVPHGRPPRIPRCPRRQSLCPPLSRLGRASPGRVKRRGRRGGRSGRPGIRRGAGRAQPHGAAGSAAPSPPVPEPEPTRAMPRGGGGCCSRRRGGGDGGEQPPPAPAMTPRVGSA